MRWGTLERCGQGGTVTWHVTGSGRQSKAGDAEEGAWGRHFLHLVEIPLLAICSRPVPSFGSLAAEHALALSTPRVGCIFLW